MTTAAAGPAAQRVREFRLPDVGEGLTEAEILRWYVQPGDTVTDGQVVCEVETAKAAVELPIPFDGAVRELLVEEGTTVDVGTVIITVDTAPGDGPVDGAPEAADAATTGAEDEGAGDGGTGERQPVLVGYGVSTSSTKRRPRKPVPGQASGPAAGAASGPPPAGQGPAGGQPAGAQPAGGAPQRAAESAPPADTAPPTTPQPGPAPASAELNGHRATSPAGPSGGRPLAKPPVRKLAKDLGVDLATVTPSGPHSTVTREDVRAAAEARTQGAPATERPVPSASDAPPASPASPISPTSPTVSPAAAPPSVTPQSLTEIRERRVPVKGVRKATAQAMVNSAFTAPHVTEFITVDVTRTMKLVDELKQDPELAGLRINPLLLVAKAFLVAIRRHPEVNAAWDEENQEIVQKDYVNLGIAAATPRGLLVPNIKDAGRKTLSELSTALAELIATARDGRTTPADMQGGTVTITNVGVFGVDTGTPILNPGESAILAFGAIRLQPWVHKGKVKPRQVTTLALSFDHRLIDGELGSRVLADIAAVLERPKRLISWG